jgi:hypothetical protein
MDPLCGNASSISGEIGPWPGVLLAPPAQDRVGAGGRVVAKGLWTRLNAHASGRRSGDQFCVYIGDRQVVAGPEGGRRPPAGAALRM